MEKKKMLEIIYNDSYSQLTLMNNLNNESLVVIDDDFKVYETLSYNPFEPNDDDLFIMWEKSIKRYFRIGKKDNFTDWRKSMYEKSKELFMDWLKIGGKENALC